MIWLTERVRKCTKNWNNCGRIYRTFFFVTYERAPFRPFQLSQMFVGNARRLPLE